jgi:hypothetical protein
MRSFCVLERPLGYEELAEHDAQDDDAEQPELEKRADDVERNAAG